MQHLQKTGGCLLRFRTWLFSARLQPCQGCCLPRVASRHSRVITHLLVESGQPPIKEFSMSEATPSALTMPTRTESDSMGKIEVPADRYYGAQTARSLIHFAIGKDTMPPELIRAFGILKKAAALVNLDLAKLSPEKANLTAQPPAEAFPAKPNIHSPLRICEPASGTKSTMT